MEPVLTVIVSVAAAWLLLVVVLWVLRPRDVAIRELVGVVPDVLRLVRDLLTDRATPTAVRIALAILLAWLVSPIDLIPEFIPILGPLDDVIVAVLVLRFVRRRLGADAMRSRWLGTDAGWDLLSRLLGGAH